MMKIRLVVLVCLIAGLLFPAIPPLRAQRDSYLLTSYTPTDSADDVIRVHIENEQLHPDGSVSADISLEATSRITYGLQFAVNEGTLEGGAIEYLLLANDIAIPLYGRATQPIGRMTFAPGTRLNISLNKLGFSQMDAAMLLGYDLLTAMSRWWLGDWLPANPVADRLGYFGRQLRSAFPLVDIIYLIDEDDFLGAFRSLLDMIERYPEMFLEAIGSEFDLAISGEMLGDFAGSLGNLLNIREVVQIINHLIRRPRAVEVEIYLPEYGEPGLELLDLVFVIDTTGSMADDINAVRADAIEIVNAIAASSASWQIGLVTYRDQPFSPYGDAGDYVARVELDYSTDRSSIVSAINAIQVGGGGDTQEAVYSGIMTAIAFPWRDGAKKVIVVMGDAPPHDPEPVTGYTLASTLQAAFDIDPANIYPIMIADNESTRSAFQSLADGSSGRLFRAATADQVVDTVFETIASIAYEPELARLLTIGGLAQVYTTELSRLNLRSGPGLEYPVIDMLPYGMTVTVLEGPAFNAPFLWWNIETPDGTSGWAVEAAEGIVTLIPVLEEGLTLPLIAYPPADRQEAVRIYTSIWSLTEFRDITAPGEVTYQIEVEAERGYRLAFLWCADTVSRLRNILEPLSVEFLINGFTLNDTHVLQANLDGVCYAWETILSGWVRGESYQIAIHYTLSEPIFDGYGSYEAGDYSHQVTVHVR